jgi:hexulose-6-phosphate isomerase
MSRWRRKIIKKDFNRREFMTTSAAFAAGMSLTAAGAARTPGGQGVGAGQAPAAPAPPLTFKTKPHKALIARPTEEDLTRLKAAGFEGVEGNRDVLPEEAARMRTIAEKMGMRIHSVLYGWAEFNSADRKEAERTFAESEAALRTAEAFGADAVLLVPCRIGARGGRGGRGGRSGQGAPASSMRMPRPWEFQIEFDEKTGHLTRVVHGDNAPYAEYIRAHNHATDTSTEWIERLIPLAEKTKVVIALENVSNNLWVKPAIFRHFVQSFQSPWVKAYFDIGNHVRFAPPEEWILTLRDLLAKIHVKDYKLDRADPNGGGAGVNIREGDVRWPVVRQALEAVNYNGWMTIESNSSIPIEERGRRLDLILAGE